MPDVPSPSSNVDDWIKMARKWIDDPPECTVLVLGDIIYDNYAVASPLEGRGKFSAISALQYSDTSTTNIKMVGGAAKGFEFITDFASAHILGLLGNDPEGKWVLKTLRNIRPDGVHIRLRNDLSTPYFLRVFCPDPYETDRLSRHFRLDRLDPRDVNKRPRISLNPESPYATDLKLILIYDHGLGAVTPDVLSNVGDFCGRFPRTGREGAPFVVARIKHSDARAYSSLPLTALVLNWHHVFPKLELPRNSEALEKQQPLSESLLDYLNKFRKCGNFVLLGKSGEILLMSRVQGTGMAAKLFFISRSDAESRGTYFSGAGHIFTAILGLSLASPGHCTPESAVCLGLVSTIAQRSQTASEVLSRTALSSFLGLKKGAAFNCAPIATLTDEKSRNIRLVLEQIRIRGKIVLSDAISNSLEVPIKSGAGRQMVGELVASSRFLGTSRVIWLYGQSGTGKTRIAKSLCRLFGRKPPARVLDCLKVKPGAIRDALRNVEGKGALVLDEIGWDRPKPLAIRKELLPHLQDMAAENLKQVLLILTSSQDPRNVQPADLTGRIGKDGTLVRIPPLSESWEDIPYLICESVGAIAKKSKKRITRITLDALARLVICDYGEENQRKLVQHLQAACARSKRRRITTEDLPEEVRLMKVEHLVEGDVDIDLVQ